MIDGGSRYIESAGAWIRLVNTDHAPRPGQDGAAQADRDSQKHRAGQGQDAAMTLTLFAITASISLPLSTIPVTNSFFSP